MCQCSVFHNLYYSRYVVSVAVGRGIIYNIEYSSKYFCIDAVLSWPINLMGGQFLVNFPVYLLFILLLNHLVWFIINLSSVAFVGRR